VVGSALYENPINEFVFIRNRGYLEAAQFNKKRNYWLALPPLRNYYPFFTARRISEMNTETNQRNIGRKIWYGLAITLSVLLILMSIAALVGTWMMGSTLSSVTSQVLLVIEHTADGLSNTVERIDMEVAGLVETSTTISDATNQLSQNVTDKGLILTLLPEEREQKLVTQADELQQNLSSVTEALEAGLELYRSIDNLPLVSLPKPEEQTVTELEQTIADVRDTIQEVVMGIQDFRAGVSEEVGRVTNLLDDIAARLTEARQNLAQLNRSLEAMQELAAGLRSKIRLIFTSISIIVTLFLVWLIYTQVEVIRLYVQRWKELGDVTVTVLPAEDPTDSDLSDKFDAEVQEDDIPKQPQ
jgi:archaellum component FlaC